MASGDDVNVQKYRASEDPIEDVHCDTDIIVLSSDECDGDCELNITSINLTLTKTETIKNDKVNT